MSKSKPRSFTSIVLQSLGWPLFWGLSATFTFYLLIGWGVISSNLVSRYFAGHPVEFIETALFFIGFMALLIKGFDLASQFRAIPEIELPAAAEGGDNPSRAEELLTSIKKLPTQISRTAFGKRLTGALHYVQRTDSADDLDDQLRYLSDIDAERSHEGYSLVRIIVWATPMLGFLGTVIGITLALGDLSPELLVNAPKEAMQGLLAGLSIAFDTTALALSLSIVLMFGMYVVREVETQLLTLVDRRAEEVMLGRFQQTGTSTDPHVASIQKMSTEVMNTMEQVVHRQAEVWETSIAATQRQWSDALQSTSATVQSSLVGALGVSMSKVSSTMEDSMASQLEAMVAAEKLAEDRYAERWEKIQQAMQEQAASIATATSASESKITERWEEVQHGMQAQANLLAANQSEAAKHSDIMLKVLQATGEVSNLETTLNQNLSALAGSKNFEDTVMSLSAAIQLLSSRLGVSATKELRLQAEEGRAA